MHVNYPVCIFGSVLYMYVYLHALCQTMLHSMVLVSLVERVSTGDAQAGQAGSRAGRLRGLRALQQSSLLHTQVVDESQDIQLSLS